MRRRRLLILGGTTEARELAMAALPSFEVITSLAGTTSEPRHLPGEMVIGGFADTGDLTYFLRDLFVDAVVDATHPYATEISARARTACAEAGVPRLQLYRPGWQRLPRDRWSEVPDWTTAAARVPGLGQRVFLTVGRKNLAAFAPCESVWFLVRLLETDAQPPLQHFETVVGLPNSRAADEIALMRRHRIDLLVTKNSGGRAAFAKIEAARVLEVPILSVARPPPQPGPVAEDAVQAMDWLARAL